MAAASLAGRPLVAPQMVAAVMAIKAARVARGVMTMAGTAGTAPPGPTIADWPTTSHGIARVHPMTPAGPIVAGALMSREAIAGPRAQPAVAGSAPTATGRSAAAARISAMTGKVPIGRSAPTGRAAAGRAAVARLVVARHRAASGLAPIGLRAAGAPLHALATTDRQAVGEVVLTAAAGQTVQAGPVQAVDRAVQAALELLGERTRAAATAELPESMRTGQSTTACRWICLTASPRTS